MMFLVTNGPRTGQYDPKAVPDKVKLPLHEKIVILIYLVKLF